MKRKLLQIFLILIGVSLLGVSNTTGQTPVTPNASQEARALLNYLYSVYGKKTLPGQMWVPWGAPSIGEGYENSKKEINIDRCFEPGTEEYKAMWSDLKRIADHLTELRDANVPVLWRPMHECDGNWFWYGKQGGERFVKLWRTMFDYFTKERKLNNLVWVLCHTGEPSAELICIYNHDLILTRDELPDIIRQAGAIEGYEARYVFQSPKYQGRGGLIIRAPNADVGSDPRWGRTEECFGEDPYFNGIMSVAMIKGLQGDDPQYWQCFMTAYNLINGIPCTVNPVIEAVTVKQWGVDGVICTDAGGFANLTRSQRYYENTTQSGAGTVNAGINQYLDRNFEAPVKKAIEEGLLTEKRLDEVIKGTLRVFIRLGLLDPADRVPYAKIGADTLESAPWNTQKNKNIVRLATQKSIVLLKNSGNLLPLNKSSVKSIAMIGPRADQVVFDWYSSQAPYAITPLTGVKNKVGAKVKVQFALGDDVAAAVNLAKSSDVAIVCVGNNPNLDNGWKKISSPSEGREDLDRKTITLDEQEELIKQVFAANPKTIVDLKSSFPYAINWTQENVPAIVHMAHSSQEEGTALADVLFGDYNPGGRLVQTWPKSLDQLPEMLDYDIRNGRTYMYFKSEPLYPFGLGLSYTTFVWSNLKTSVESLARDGSITVNVDVQNTGKRAGDEVVQLYVKHLNSKVSRPVQELKGFQRVHLKAGETRTVAIALPAQRLAYWDISKNNWQVERDSIEIRLGASSADIRLQHTLGVQ
ncbi:MAG: glycoside hydrolase family 3 C-terminal domain-containing protein [Bacteroidales bacterium]|nr:glycoside hydrolase family 3 C-terminal domain-containing protein [Bacteroidales bacterium]